MASNITGLGRGLGSLIPNVKKESDKSTSSNADIVLSGDETLIEIPINLIRANPMQPRQVFNENELDELCESVKKYGVLSPIIVSKLEGDDGYELIAGERRWRAAKKADLSEIPAILRQVADQEKLEIAIIENIQRKNLNFLEEAFSYQRLIDEFDLTHEEVSDRLGKSRSQISNTLRLLVLPEEIQQALQNEKISFGHAKVILGIEDPSRQLEAFRKILLNNLTVRDSEVLVKKSKSKQRVVVEKDVLIEAKEDSLRDILDTKVTIDQKGNKGKIIIEFYSDEDLDELIQKIG